MALGIDKVFPNVMVEVGSWTPVLLGATNNPVVTYGTQVGRWYIVGKLCFISINIVSTTMTKSTLTDQIRIDLPFTSANRANQIARLSGSMVNGTPVKNGNSLRIIPNTGYATVYQTTLTSTDAALTYALTDIGVLTNTITFEFSGCLELVGN